MSRRPIQISLILGMICACFSIIFIFETSSITKTLEVYFDDGRISASMPFHPENVGGWESGSATYLFLPSYMNPEYVCFSKDLGGTLANIFNLSNK